MVGALVEPLFDPPEPNVREILQPFEIGHGHAAGVQVDIGNDHHAARLQDFAGPYRDGTVSGFADDLGFYEFFVASVDRVLKRRRNEDVALKLQTLGGRRQRLGTREGED